MFASCKDCAKYKVSIGYVFKTFKVGLIHSCATQTAPGAAGMLAYPRVRPQHIIWETPRVIARDEGKSQCIGIDCYTLAMSLHEAKLRKVAYSFLWVGK